MNQVVIFFSVVIGLFAVMLALMEVGWRVGVRRRRQDSAGAHVGLGVIDGAVFGLMDCSWHSLFRERVPVSTLEDN